MKAVLAWGDYETRSGWWLTGDTGPCGIIAIRGPSICESSGGGAGRALAIARELFEGEIEVQLCRHSTVDGAVCQIDGCAPSNVAMSVNMTTPTIRLPTGHYATVGAYAKAWAMIKARHNASMYAGRHVTYAGFFDYPALTTVILAEMRKGLADRINRRDPAYGKGRRWDTDYQAALARDAKMLRYFRAYGGVGIPRQRFETDIFLKRYRRPEDGR